MHPGRISREARRARERLCVPRGLQVGQSPFFEGSHAKARRARERLCVPRGLQVGQSPFFRDLARRREWRENESACIVGCRSGKVASLGGGSREGANGTTACMVRGMADKALFLANTAPGLTRIRLHWSNDVLVPFRAIRVRHSKEISLPSVTLAKTMSFSRHSRETPQRNKPPLRSTCEDDVVFASFA